MPPLSYGYSPAAINLAGQLLTLPPAETLSTIVAAVNTGEITAEEAVMLTDHKKFDAVAYSSFEGVPEAHLTVGYAGAAGAATGKVITSVAEAMEEDAPFILYVHETTPQDMPCIKKPNCVGVITEVGGVSSHATVLTSRLGKACVAGVGSLNLVAGDTVSIDGQLGAVVSGEVAIRAGDADNQDRKTIAAWAKDIDYHRPDVRRLFVGINSCEPEEAKHAFKEYGADRLGVLQTEYTFAREELVSLMQKLLVYPTSEQHTDALRQYFKHSDHGPAAVQRVLDNKPSGKNLTALFNAQKADFKEMLQATDGREATIRLLDAPLEEFKPTPAEIQRFAADIEDTLAPEKRLGVEERIKEINKFFESDTRGIRLGLLKPEIYQTQVCALLTALDELREEGHTLSKTDIMLPLVGDMAQFSLMQGMLNTELEKFPQLADKLPTISVMMETVGACVVADKLAEAGVQKFSFGTNDLTSFTFDYKRDSALPEEFSEIFSALHPHVMTPMAWAINGNEDGSLVGARAINPNAIFTICGEQGADRSSIYAAQKALDINGVSVSPQKVLSTRLHAAQAYVERCYLLDLQATYAKNQHLERCFKQPASSYSAYEMQQYAALVSR